MTVYARVQFFLCRDQTMGKGKRSREPGTRRRTILQIDSNKISRSSNVRAAPVEPAAAPAKDPVDDQVAEFLREISALEQEQENTKSIETDPSDSSNNPSTNTTLPANSSLSETKSTAPHSHAPGNSQPALPEGWDRILDTNSGYHYFWNVHSNETRWDPPPQNPVGLSLISSAYSESDSDSPLSNQPVAPATEGGGKNREIPQENKPQSDVSLESQMHPKSVPVVNQKQETVSSHQTSLVHRHHSDNEGNSDVLKPKAKRAREDPKPPSVHASTQTEEEPQKPTENALRPLIQQLAAELTHKLDFLGISAQQLNQLQAMLVQLETRISDWRSGHLPSEYALSRLQESARILCEYEQSAAPVGWGCTWDPSSQRYQYIQVSSGVTMWEYPTATAASTEVLEDEDMVLSGGESDENPPLPPMPPSPSGPPPPPSSQNDHKSLVEANPPPPPLPSSNPPLPDLPPIHTPAPPPLPEFRESTLPEEPPPLPPSRQDSSSPPLPPCPEGATPPLPPSDTSSHMSQSPSTLPNSPCPPSEPDTHPQEPIVPEPYNTSLYDGTQHYVQYEQQPQQLVYAYYTPPPYPPTQTNTPPVETRGSTSPTPKVKGKGRKAPNTSSLATHAVSVKKKGMANMLEKWQQLSTVETSSGESESEPEGESSLKQRIEEWKKEQVVSGRAKENANFHNIRGNWKEKIQFAKRAQQGETSLLISKQTEG